MAFKVAVIYFSRRGRLVVLANVIAAGARQVGYYSPLQKPDCESLRHLCKID